MISDKRDEFVAGSRRRRHAAKISPIESMERGWHRIYAVYPMIFRAAPALFSLVLFVPSYAAAAENEDIAVLRRMLGELKAENRKLSQRLSALEVTSAPRRIATSTSSTTLSPTSTTARGFVALDRFSADLRS